MRVKFDDKMGHRTHEMEALGIRESGVLQERVWRMRIVPEAALHGLSWTPWSEVREKSPGKYRDAGVNRGAREEKGMGAFL